jgi:selenocysteine lyase/cysteine desulfurase
LVPAYAARSSLASRAIDRDHLEFRPDAARFEAGNLNYAGIHALDAALDLILGTGVAAIQAHVLAVARALMEGLASRGVEIVTPQEDAQRAGIVVFRSGAAEAMAARLRAKHVIVSAIDGCVRAAPHGYTSLRQIEAFLAALDEARRC